MCVDTDGGLCGDVAGGMRGWGMTRGAGGTGLCVDDACACSGAGVAGLSVGTESRACVA